jgi:hypothetical protein
MPMKNRPRSLMILACAAMALGVMIAPVLADELMGRITKVNADSKTITVIEKDTDKLVDVKVNDDTVFLTKNGEQKVDLEKLENGLEKAKQGIPVVVTHEKGVASKIKYAGKGKAQLEKEKEKEDSKE